MSGFPILDLVVGIIFIYFLLSIISSSAIEVILTGLNARAKLLEEWLVEIFEKKVTQPNGKEIKLGKAIMDHCAITALSGANKATSYIDAKNFASALLEKITYDPENPKSIAKDIDSIIKAINDTTILSIEIQRTLLTYANDAKDTYKNLSDKTVSEIELFRGKVENWYDSSMERVTGTLKTRYSRPATFVVALVVTVLLNADSISIAKYLYSNPEVRTKIAMAAFDGAKDSALIETVQQMRAVPGDTTHMNLDETKKKIISKLTDIERAKQGLDDVMPLTWQSVSMRTHNGKFSALLLLSKITGLLVTILAIMMGAPFWFDILNKISNVRGVGARPSLSTSEEEKIRK